MLVERFVGLKLGLNGLVEPHFRPTYTCRLSMTVIYPC
jgi:hypothetical protein